MNLTWTEGRVWTRSRGSSCMRSMSRGADMRAINWEGWSTGLGDSTTKTAACMRATGKKAGWQASANSTTNPTNSPTRVNGKTTSSTAKASSTTNTPSHYADSSTTATSMRSSSTGPNTKVLMNVVRWLRLRHETWSWNLVSIQWLIFWGVVSQRLRLRLRHLCHPHGDENPRPLAEQPHVVITP